MWVARASGVLVPKYLATGTGAGTGLTGTQTVSYTDNIPDDTKLSLIWAFNSSSAANPTISCTVGGVAATLVKTTLCTTFGTYIYVTCFALLGPPKGSQAVAFTTTTNNVSYVRAVHYAGVGSLGAPIELASQTSAVASISASDTNAHYLYANGFVYQTGGDGNSYSSYSQTQRFMQASNASITYPALAGDAVGNGGVLTFSASRSLTTYNWAGLIVPLMP